MFMLIEPFWIIKDISFEFVLNLRDASGPCGDGKHVWIYTSTSADSEIPSDLTMLCACGMVRWCDREEIRRDL